MKIIIFIFILILTLLSQRLIAGPENGSLFGLSLNEVLSDIDESKARWNQFGTKSIYQYNNIFPEENDRTNLLITPLTNTIYEIEVSVIFNDEKKANEFYGKYTQYFQGKYYGMEEETHSFWPNEAYNIDNKYILSINHFTVFPVDPNWREHIGEDFFKTADSDYNNRSAVEKFHDSLLGKISNIRVVVISLDYHTDNQEYINLMKINTDELNEYKIKSAINNNIILP